MSLQEFTVPTQDQGKELVAAREFSFYHPGLHKPVQMAKVFCFLKQNANATWQSKMDCTKWTLSLHMIIPIKLLLANAIVFLEYLRDFNEVIFPRLNVPLSIVSKCGDTVVNREILLPVA